MPFHASQTSGGSVGSTPTPRTWQSRCSPIAHDGAASSRPSSNASSYAGCSEKHANSVARLISRHGRRGRRRRPGPDVREPPRRHRPGRSVVANTMASSCSVRRVPTSVLRRDDDVLRWRRREPGRTSARAGVGGKQRDADEVEEGDVQLVGHPVQPVEQLVGHERERLDERDAGVGDVVIGPLGAPCGDEPLGVVDEVLEAAVVEVRHGQGHGSRSDVRSGIT